MAVAERVKKMIVEQLGVNEAEVVPEAKFIDDLGADSLDIVELVMALEDEYGIDTPMRMRKRSRPWGTPSAISRSTRNRTRGDG